MEQLVKVTTTPFQAIRFTQSARLIPCDNIDVERRKAMARHFAFTSRYSAGSASSDLEYMNQVNKAFSSHSVSVSPQAAAPRTAGSQAKAPLPAAGNRPPQQHIQAPHTRISHGAPAAVLSQAPVPSAGFSAASASAASSVVSSVPSAPARSVPAQQSISAEVQSAYTMQRGALELRVAKGELAFVPPLVMTVITQYPEIHFEYTGGFNYVPPSSDPRGDNMNLSI